MRNSKDIILRVVFRPYLKGRGPAFTLTLWGPGHLRNGRWYLDYSLTQSENGRTVTLFSGDDFGPSQLHAWDADETVVGLMGFLTLRPGDTDDEYFSGYTPLQAQFCVEHAEALSVEVTARFGELGGRPPAWNPPGWY